MPWSGLIRADVATGKLRGDPDAEAAVSLIVGAYLGELVRRGSVDDVRRQESPARVGSHRRKPMRRPVGTPCHGIVCATFVVAASAVAETRDSLSK